MATKKTENPVVEAVYSISRQVAAALNIGDAGKVDSFIGKIEKDALKAIRGYEKNIDNINFNLKNDIEDFEEQLQDAEVELAEAYKSIPIDRIQSNQDQNEFKHEYLMNIRDKKQAIENIKKYIEDAKDFAKEKEVVKIGDDVFNIGTNGLEKRIKDAKEIVAEVTKKD